MKSDMPAAKVIKFQFLGLLLSIIYFWPYLSFANIEQLFFDDLYNLYYPQFLEGFNRYSSGSLLGIDFLTGNGASSYSMRPNIPVFYPIYLLVYVFFDAVSAKVDGNVFMFVFVFHAFICYFFTFIVCSRFFRLSAGVSLIVSVGYTFAISRWIGIAPFLYISALFPSLIYFGFVSAISKSINKSFLSSLATYLVFTAGYPPLAMHAVVLSLLICFIALGYKREYDHSQWLLPKLKTCFFLILPVIFATIACTPYYFGMYLYQKLTPGLPNFSWYATSDWHYTWIDYLSMLTSSFTPDVNPSETPHIYFGLITVFLFIVGATNVKNLHSVGLSSSLLKPFALIVLVHLFLMTGSETAVPLLFYYSVPIIGEMHLYGRFFISASFCLFLILGITVQHLQERDNSSRVKILKPLLAFLFAVAVIAIIRDVQQPFQDKLFFELSIIILFAISWHWRLFSNISIAVVIILYLSHYAIFANYPSNIKVDNPPVNQTSLVFDKGRLEALINFIQNNTEKEFVKYIDLTDSISKTGGAPPNLPYFLDRKIILSNYVGYEVHNSLEVNYLKHGIYFGKFNKNWLDFTEPDFVIFNDRAARVHSEWLERKVGGSNNILDLGNGYRIAKISWGDSSHVFNNGIYAVACAGEFSLDRFIADYSTFVQLEYNCDEPSELKLMLYPSSNMTMKINSEEINLSDAMPNGKVLMVPQGRNVVVYEFSNPWMRLFVLFSWAYFGLFIVTMTKFFAEHIHAEKYLSTRT